MPVDGAVAGASYPDHWIPYKLWAGDLWICEGCNAEIVVGVAPSPIAIQHQADFEDKIKTFGPELQVTDC